MTSLNQKYVHATILTLVTFGTAYSAERNDITATRPHPKGQPTTVHVGIFVFDVARVDDVEQTFTADVIVHLRWADPRLASELGEPRRFDLAEVWHPRIQISNERRAARKHSEQVEVTPDGDVTYHQRFSGTFVAPFDLRDFPLDEQMLSVRILFQDYTERELQFEIDGETTGRSPLFVIPDWTIDDGRSRVDPLTFTPALSRATMLYELKARRHVQYYTLKIMLPLVLIVCMSWAAF